MRTPSFLLITSVSSFASLVSEAYMRLLFDKMFL